MNENHDDAETVRRLKEQQMKIYVRQRENE